MTDSDTTLRSVIIWVCEGTWRATVDAALSLAPAPARFTVLHVTSRAPADAARGAYLGLLGRGGRDPGARFDEVAAEAAADLVAAAVRRRAAVRTAGNSGSFRTGRGGSLRPRGPAHRGA